MKALAILALLALAACGVRGDPVPPSEAAAQQDSQ
jgi:predicted small lipoprotein YifL